MSRRDDENDDKLSDDTDARDGEIHDPRADENLARDVLPVPEDRADTINGVLRFIHLTAQHLRHLEKDEGTAYRVSLTFPRPWIARSSMYGLADAYATMGDFDPRWGMWLMADWSATGALHWYGLAIRPETREHLAERWVKMTGASPSATRVTPLVNERARRSLDFRKDLARVVHYACKDVPRVPITLAERAIASGAFFELWRKATGNMAMDADYNPPLPEQAGPVRLCRLDVCRHLIGPEKRGDADFCSDSCRKRFNEKYGKGSKSSKKPK